MSRLKSISEKYIVIAIMLLGILARGFLTWRIPDGINQDEAYAGYEAYSLLHYGMDSWGYHFPVYFISWGSGMNVLESYLMIPFVALFGLTKFAVRMPQFLVSVASLWVFYKLLREMLGKSSAVYAAFLYFAICPWHITMSRWALESNLAPGFLLFGLYTFVLAQKDARYYMLSALFYGLSLYAYATIWVIVPFVILLQLIYVIWSRKFHFSRYELYAVLILAIFALPLILFMCVNYYEILDEIRTPVFSVPKLIAGRTSEINFWQKRQNFEHLVEVISGGYDGWVHNATEEFGLYYRWGLFVGIIGFLYALIRSLVNLARRKYDAINLVFAQFIMSVVLGCLILVNINRINCIHIPIITFIGIGLYAICSFVGRYFKPFTIMVCAAMFICFISFELYYFTGYRQVVSWQFQASAEEKILDALDEADEDETIYIDPTINFAKILFYSKMPTPEFTDTVEYSNYPYEYLAVSRMGRFVFDIENAPEGAVKVEMNY